MQEILYDGTEQEVFFNLTFTDYTDCIGSTDGEILTGVTVVIKEFKQISTSISSPSITWDLTLQKWKLIIPSLTQYGDGIITIQRSDIITETINFYAGSEENGSGITQLIKKDGTDQELYFNIAYADLSGECIGSTNGEALESTTVAIREYKRATITISSPAITWDLTLKKWRLVVPSGNLTQDGYGIITIQRADLLPATIEYTTTGGGSGYNEPAISNWFISSLSPQEIEKRLVYVEYLEQLHSFPIGIEWDTASSSKTLKWIDIDGNELHPTQSFFDNHIIWGRIKRCVRDRVTGDFTPGSNNRGDGLKFDGSMGDVFGEIPTYRFKYEAIGTLRRYHVIPYAQEESVYSLHPMAVQRGGIAHDKIYLACYPAGLRDDNGVLKLDSVAGVQPWTGTEFKSLPFNSGGTKAYTVGETLTGTTSGATGVVVDFHLTSGGWSTGDATGVVYLRNITGTFQAENLNGSTAGANCATSTASTSTISMNLEKYELYANNIGTNFGVCNPWTWYGLVMLMVIEAGTWDLQSWLGRGVVDLATGTGYAGKLNGADEVDDRMNVNGTGIGSGIDGKTPVCWRGFVDLWGGLRELLIGLNMFLDGSFRVIHRNGTANPVPSLTVEGTYESGTGAATTTGFISNIHSGPLGALTFTPTAVAGTSSTYVCDQFVPAVADPSLVRVGGAWFDESNAGPNCKNAGMPVSSAVVNTGARIEYIPV